MVPIENFEREAVRVRRKELLLFVTPGAACMRALPRCHTSLPSSSCPPYGG